MNYTSTRDTSQKVTVQQAILKGIAPGGGLFVPTELPKLNLSSLVGKSYPEVAFEVIKGYLPDYDEQFLKNILQETYGENFDNKAGNLVKIKKNLFSLELWHGPTSAFKDYALQLVPKLLLEAKKMLGEKDTVIILVATSGDTGKAALEGYKDLPGIKICVFYPENGTSEIQRLQMVTQEGYNVAVYAVKGNFDDTQRGVKTAFTDEVLAEKLSQENKRLSSANSINWGRLLPQIVYYVNTYVSLCQSGNIAMGQEIDFCVPTGNFGDIMAGYYAKQMGVPIGQLLCASNKNNVLSDFFKTGKYNANREFFKTSSPSMDVLVSSNLERLLYHITQDGAQVSAWMKDLAEKGEYQVDDATLAKINTIFKAGWASEKQVDDAIARTYKDSGYLIDPHTAVAVSVAEKIWDQKNPMVVLSTASPYKFSEKVLAALGNPVPPQQDEFVTLYALEEQSKTKAPTALTELSSKPVRFTEVISASEVSKIPSSL